MRRYVDKLTIIPLFGLNEDFENLDDALNFVSAFNEDGGSGKFRKFEIVVGFSNGDRLDGSFNAKEDAIAFLKYVSGPPGDKQDALR